MQTVKTFGAILLVIVVFSFVHANIGVNAAIVFACLVVAFLLLRKKPSRNDTPVRAPDTSSGESEWDSDDAPVSIASARRQTLRDMDQHTYVIMANNRRSEERRKRLEAESEVLTLMSRNRELQDEVDRLNGRPNPKKTYDDMPPDPFAD